MTRLEYSKLILKKMSFDRSLLQKEYDKARKLLGVSEVSNLRQWCKEEFGIYALQFLETEK